LNNFAIIAAFLTLNYTGVARNFALFIV